MSKERVLEQLRLDLSTPGGGVASEHLLPRPTETPRFGGSDFEGAKVNHLTELEVGRREGLGGKVEIVINGAIVAAAVFVERFYRKRFSDPFRDGGEALFPSGAAPIDTEADVIPPLVGTVLVTRQLNDADFLAFIASLNINADEQYVLQLRKDTGGALVGDAVMDYDLGGHEQDARGTIIA